MEPDETTQQREETSPENALRRYEFIYLLSGRLTKEAAGKEERRIKGLIVESGGTLLENENRTTFHPAGNSTNSPATPQEVNEADLRLRSLAYPIKKELLSYAGTLSLHGPAELVNKIREALKLDAALLRYMIVKKTPRARQKQRSRIWVKPNAAPNAGKPETEVPAGQRWPAENEPLALAPENEKPFAPEPINVADIDKKLEELIG